MAVKHGEVTLRAVEHIQRVITPKTHQDQARTEYKHIRVYAAVSKTVQVSTQTNAHWGYLQVLFKSHWCYTIVWIILSLTEH